MPATLCANLSCWSDDDDARVWCYKMAPGHWHSLSHSGEDANELCSLEMQKLWAFDFEESCARWIMCFWWLFDCEMESFNFWCQVIGTFLNRCNIFVQLCYGVSRLLKSDALMVRTSVRLHPSVRFCMHSLFRCDPVCCTFSWTWLQGACENLRSNQPCSGSCIRAMVSRVSEPRHWYTHSILLATSSSIFLSHQINTSHQPPANSSKSAPASRTVLPPYLFKL